MSSSQQQQRQKHQITTVSREYTHINSQEPVEYSDYDNATLVWGESEPYEIVRKLGRGKYSEVFEGIDTRTNSKCVIKVLKPIKPKKINREVKILQNLSGGRNIINLLEIVKDPKVCFIFGRR